MEQSLVQYRRDDAGQRYLSPLGIVTFNGIVKDITISLLCKKTATFDNITKD